MDKVKPEREMQEGSTWR